ncbi:hypothetical protein [Rhizobium sp. GR12]|uniref:hypothetical protein n=1 Tax=Rhizobium sp. GR12 TaxID=3053925 RepID=UPI002FBD4705
MHNDDKFPWNMTHELSTTCEIGDYALYAGELPDMDGEAAWFVRQRGRVVANGIADDLGAAQAQAEQATENWTERDLRVYG